MMIELRDVVICQGTFSLGPINLQIEQNSYAVLMGPTGCGKTTLVEAICGLRKVQSGRILIDGSDVTHLDAARRGIGYVPQDRALFPTMRVERQVEYGLRLRNASSQTRQQRVAELAEMIGISSLLGRLPKGLSGGEQQRVALARALSFRPKVVCLDEPMSALDDASRKQMADLLKRIHETEDVTIFHITHNLEDAIQLGTQHFRFEGDDIVAGKSAATR